MTVSRTAAEKYPLTYRYDGDDLPDRDAAAKREGFDAGLQYALNFIEEFKADYTYHSTIDFDEGYIRGLEFCAEMLELELKPEGS